MRADDQDKSAPPPKAGARPADKLFLGPEFLTWLYFFLEEEGFELEIGTDVVRFSIGRRTVLTSLDAQTARVALTGPDLDDSGELVTAVRRGALIDLLSLQIAISERVYEVALRSDGGFSVKVPDLSSDGEDGQKKRIDAADLLDLRMMVLDDCERVMDDLFRRFVTRRLARAWHTEDLSSMRRVVASRLKRMVDA
jgi:hypothetical protein